MALFYSSRRQFEAEVGAKASEMVEHVIAEMGAELHDELIQRLLVFQFYLERLDQSSTDVQQVSMLINRMRSEFDEVNKSVRAVSRRLLPPLSQEESFTETLHLLCQNMERAGHSLIIFKPEGEERPIPFMVQTYLYRIVQELIHNAYKHSSAWRINVRLGWSASRLMIEVEDDGSGFSRVQEFIERLRSRRNTLYFRTRAINADIQYIRGANGLLARVEYPIEQNGYQHPA